MSKGNLHFEFATLHFLRIIMQCCSATGGDRQWTSITILFSLCLLFNRIIYIIIIYSLKKLNMFCTSVTQIRIIVVLLSFPILLFRYFRLEINFILITSDEGKAGQQGGGTKKQRKNTLQHGSIFPPCVIGCHASDGTPIQFSHTIIPYISPRINKQSSIFFSFGRLHNGPTSNLCKMSTRWRLFSRKPV